MSQWLLSEDHYSINTKEQWLGDQVVKMHKNVKYTFVNPGLFAFAYFFIVEVIAQLGMMPVAIKGAASSDVGLNAPPSERVWDVVAINQAKDPLVGGDNNLEYLVCYIVDEVATLVELETGTPGFAFFLRRDSCTKDIDLQKELDRYLFDYKIINRGSNW